MRHRGGWGKRQQTLLPGPVNNARVLTFYLSSRSVCRVRPKLKRLASSTQIIVITQIMERYAAYAALFFDTIRDDNLPQIRQEILIAFRGDI